MAIFCMMAFTSPSRQQINLWQIWVCSWGMVRWGPMPAIVSCDLMETWTAEPLMLLVQALSLLDHPTLTSVQISTPWSWTSLQEAASRSRHSAATDPVTATCSPQHAGDTAICESPRGTKSWPGSGLTSPSPTALRLAAATQSALANCASPNTWWLPRWNPFPRETNKSAIELFPPIPIGQYRPKPRLFKRQWTYMPTVLRQWSHCCDM